MSKPLFAMTPAPALAPRARDLSMSNWAHLVPAGGGVLVKDEAGLAPWRLR